MARFSAWTTGLVLAFFGSQIAHALTYAAVTPDAQQRATVLAQTGHSYFAYVPFAFGLLGAVAALGLAARLVATERTTAPLGWPVALLPLLTFVVQEHVERIVQQGSFPWHAVLDPTFAPGLLLQLPLGILAYIVARALLRGADRVAAILRSGAPRVAPRALVTPAPATPELPLSAVRLRVRAPRGPPALVAV
jgi:hypothetical protein